MRGLACHQWTAVPQPTTKQGSLHLLTLVLHERSAQEYVSVTTRSHRRLCSCICIDRYIVIYENKGICIYKITGRATHTPSQPCHGLVRYLRMFSYAVKVTAWAGAALMIRRVVPRYNAATPSFRRQSKKIIRARVNSDTPRMGDPLCNLVLTVSNGVLAAGAAIPAQRPTKVTFHPVKGAPSCFFSRYVLRVE